MEVKTVGIKTARGPRGPSRKKVAEAAQGVYFLEDVANFRVDRANFIIYVGGDPHHAGTGEDQLEEPGVEYRMANRFEQNLNTLSGIDMKRPITVILSSCGGGWEEGMQMFSAILTCPNPIVVIAVKDARSMTSIIPLAADHFVIRPPAKYMIHRGQFSLSGLDQEADTNDIQRRIANKQMMLIYAARLKARGKYSRMSYEEIEHMLSQRMQQEIDVWHTADQAMQAGFADGIFLGDYEELRGVRRDEVRRKDMFTVLRAHIGVSVRVTVKQYRETVSASRTVSKHRRKPVLPESVAK